MVMILEIKYSIPVVVVFSCCLVLSVYVWVYHRPTISKPTVTTFIKLHLELEQYSVPYLIVKNDAADIATPSLLSKDNRICLSPLLGVFERNMEWI